MDGLRSRGETLPVAQDEIRRREEGLGASACTVQAAKTCWNVEAQNRLALSEGKVQVEQKALESVS